MRLVVALLVCAVAASAFVVTSDNVDVVFKFDQWAEAHGKKYATEEAYEYAMSVYEQNAAVVVELAKQHPGAQFKLNKFADMTVEEFRAKLLTYRHAPAPFLDVAHVKPVHATPPDTFDWRSQKAVSPVKDQGQCGSCWAFSATESIESQSFLLHKKMPILSPQQIVDCDTVDQACNGGNTETAYAYVTQAGGLDTAKSYPYTSGDSGQAGSCNFQQNSIAAKINNFTYAVPPCYDGACNKQNENLLRTQLVAVGPLSICVNANPWQFYSGGILSGCSHAAADLDHCVQLVGYAWTSKYWIIRNSWGTDWGNAGYIYVATGKNECGVANDVTSATAL
jgi:C1A family cysteine protease